jgi:hypothetical protein
MFAVSGCATTWSPVGGEYQGSKEGYATVFPEGWLKINTAHRKDPLLKGVAITREGTMLQSIRVGFMELDEAFLNTKKTLNEKMLPQEAAEVVTDNYRLAKGVLEFNLLENVPVDVGGYPGFRLLFEYKSDSRMWLSRMFYGVIVKDRFYFLHYHAPKRYYFERDLKTFQAVVDNFRPLL